MCTPRAPQPSASFNMAQVVSSRDRVSALTMRLAHVARASTTGLDAPLICRTTETKFPDPSSLPANRCASIEISRPDMPCIKFEALAGIVPLYPASASSWLRIASRFFSSGGVNWSSIPKRDRMASSTTSRRFVAPIIQIPSSLPENSARNALVTS